MAASDLRGVEKLIQGDLNDVGMFAGNLKTTSSIMWLSAIYRLHTTSKGTVEVHGSLLVPTGSVIATTATLAQLHLDASSARAEESSALISSVEGRQPFTDVDLEESFLSAGFAITHLGRLDPHVMSGVVAPAQSVIGAPSSLAGEKNVLAADFVALAFRLPGPPVRVLGCQINTLRRRAELAELDSWNAATTWSRLETESAVCREEMAASSEAL